MKSYIDYDMLYDRLDRMLRRAEIEGEEKGIVAIAIKYFMELIQEYRIPLDKIK